MRLTKAEKERLYELMDMMSSSVPYIDEFDNDRDRNIFYQIFKKLRMEIKGF